jgi:hypothetical protein
LSRLANDDYPLPANEEANVQLVILWGDQHGKGQGRITVENQPLTSSKDFLCEGRGLAVAMVQRIVARIAEGSTSGEIGRIKWWVSSESE